jgi:predicted RNA-binding Zn-ribbon protein involved in translation (DUF1610 family)
MSIERKLKRKNKTKGRKPEKEISDTLMMFDRLPEECLACEKAFDKQDKEMATTWNVVVREKEGIVRLYCPECWAQAIEVTKSFLEEKSEENSKL